MFKIFYQSLSSVYKKLKSNISCVISFPGIHFYVIVALINLTTFDSYSQIQVLQSSNLQARTGWVVYNLGSIAPGVITPTFNHTAARPAAGVGGCLRLTSPQASSVLVWQKVTVRGGETFTADGAIKINNVSNFYAELYVSTVAPVEGVDYSPNGNADVVAGFSTWVGCGPNVDGTFAINSCTGKKTFVAPGTAGSLIDVFFGLKVGSSAAPIPAPMEVLVDELKLTRAAYTGNDVTAFTAGTTQANTLNLTIPNNLKAVQLKSGISVSPNATFRIVNASNVEVNSQSVVTSMMRVVVTAENGVVKTYLITPTLAPLAVETFNNFTGTVVGYTNRIIDFTGACQVTISRTDKPLEGSVLNLRSEDIWLYFPNIRPDAFYKQYRSQLLINGQEAVVDRNVRIDQYLQGTMVISQPSSYQALQIYNAENFGGTSQSLGNYTYYRSAQLAGLDNATRSFRLKRGYMATLANDEQGTGYSCVYIADKADLYIPRLPNTLTSQVSFIRVIPWRWTAKKGWTSGVTAPDMLRSHWQYDWNNVDTSTLNIEYVPMRHGAAWNAYANINNKTKSTHALGFNEPDRPDQANMTVDQAVAAWPELLRSGLRLGSPCPSDAGPALTWLYQFVDRCDALHYRVDFIPVHWYKGGQTARQFYDWLRAIHIRTKRPLWITEWNNGANWTCCKPTYAQQAQTISEMTNMMDTASFVERYSLYEWVENTRQMFYQYESTFTPAGTVYRDNVSPMALNTSKLYNSTGPIVAGISEENNLEESGISIYPNPTEQLIHFAGGVVQAKLYSVQGELLQKIAPAENMALDLSGLPSGLYIVELYNGRRSWREKIVKCDK